MFSYICCCLDLRIGAFLVGCTCFIVAVVSAFLNYFYQDFIKVPDETYVPLRVLHNVYLGSCVITILVSTLACIGARLENFYLLMPLMAWIPVAQVGGTGVVIWILFSDLNNEYKHSIAAIALVSTVFSIYFLLVLAKYFYHLYNKYEY